MKLCKYYSLDECYERDLVFEELDSLQDDAKIEYTYIKDDDVIKIKNTGLSAKEAKDLVSFFKDNDVIDYSDYEEYEDDEDYEDDEEGDEDYEY